MTADTAHAAERVHQISLREIAVGVLIAIVGFAIEDFAFTHDPDIRVYISHIMEPIVAATVLPLVAGVSWPATWAFFMSSVKTLAALASAFGVAGALFVTGVWAVHGDTAAIVSLGVIAGVLGAGLLALVLLTKAVGSPAPAIEDDENPFVTWTWGIPLPNPRMPGHGFDDAYSGLGDNSDPPK
jgi:hypothetical protein